MPKNLRWNRYFVKEHFIPYNLSSGFLSLFLSFFSFFPAILKHLQNQFLKMFEYNLIQILPEFFSPKVKYIVHETRVQKEAEKDDKKCGIKKDL